MEDIAPGLLLRIQESFRQEMGSNQTIQALLKKIEDGDATYRDAEQYALQIGEALSQAFEKNLGAGALPDGKMYYNIADRVLRPLLEEDHAVVSDAARMVQESLNRKAGVGLKAQQVAVNQDRIQGIVDKVSNAESFEDVSWVLDEPVKNFSMNVVDETIRENVSFQGKAGLRPRVIRRAERKCCKWCSALEGEYDYPDVPHDVYRRHDNCRCTMEYDPADGKRKRQNVHTKEWTDAGQYDKLEARKKVGVHSLVYDLEKHPKRLASFTPEKLKLALEADGFEVKPLMNGSLKGIPFEEGGGYKVNFEDGGLFQYHPAKNSHHNGEYYKISTGKGGIKHYDAEGNEIPNRGKK